MKRIIMIASLMLIGASFNESSAQVRVGVNINIGSQPLWGPTGYDYARYYYLPDFNIYYSVPERVFIFRQAGRWTRSASLPPRYARYNLYNSYKVVINDRDPWLRDSYYKRKFASYRGRHGQSVIRDSRDERYWEIKDHPHHKDWQRKHPGRGHDRDHHGHPRH